MGVADNNKNLIFSADLTKNSKLIATFLFSLSPVLRIL